MRTRKRPDWPVLVYKYWVEPIGELPQELWQIAKLMQKTWNDLVDLREQTRSNIAAIENISSQEKKAHWQQFEEQSRLLVKNSGLNWECQGEILDRFRTSCTAKKHPKHHHKLEKISIPHRFTAGGREVRKLFTESSKAFSIRSVKKEAYENDKQENRRLRASRGYFGLNESRIDFLINIHRPLPEESFIKKVSFLGRNRNVLGWEWSVANTVEQAPSRIENLLPSKVCGIDLGWRKFDEYLRFAVVVDNTGKAMEFRLPFDASTSETRRYNKKFQHNNPIIDDWRHIEENQRKLDLMLEETKTKLKKLLSEVTIQLPEEIANRIAYLTKMRNGGLIKLMYQLREAKILPECQELIANWKEKNDGLLRRINSAREHFINRRNWLYENLALYLAENYCDIAWEGDLGLKDMAEMKQMSEADKAKLTVEQKYALRNSMVYRQFVGLSEFRSRLEKACEKTGCNLVDCEVVDTSSICGICGSGIKVGVSRICECAKGHKMDNDVNAAIMLLGQIEPSFKTSDKLKDVYRGNLPKLDNVREELKKFCVVASVD